MVVQILAPDECQSTRRQLKNSFLDIFGKWKRAVVERVKWRSTLKEICKRHYIQEVGMMGPIRDDDQNIKLLMTITSLR